MAVARRTLKQLSTAVDWHAVLARCSPEAAAAIRDVRSRHAEVERLLAEAQAAQPVVDLAAVRARLLAGPPADSAADTAAAERLLAEAQRTLDEVDALQARPADVSALDAQATGAVAAAKRWYAAVEAQIAALQGKLAEIARQPQPEDMAPADILRENPVLGAHIHDALAADDWSSSVPDRPARAPAVEGVADAADYGRVVAPMPRRAAQS